MNKAWWKSKTFWVNLICVVALLVQSLTRYIISPEIQAAVLALINLILRAVTKEPLAWASGDDSPPITGGPGAGMAVVLLAGSLALALSGCATTGNSASSGGDSPLILGGKSLLAVKGTIVSAAAATDALCDSGKLAAADCLAAKAAYQKAQPAYDAAVDAYLLLSTRGGDAADFGAALLRVQAIAQNLLLVTDGGAR